MPLKQAFKWMTLASFTAVFAILLKLGSWSGDSAGLFALLFIWVWAAGPLALPYLLSWGDRSGGVRRTFFLVFLVDLLFTGWMFYTILSSDSSTAGLGVFTMPALSWIGVIAASTLVVAVSGYRPTLSDSAPPPQSPPPA